MKVNVVQLYVKSKSKPVGETIPFTFATSFNKVMYLVSYICSSVGNITPNVSIGYFFVDLKEMYQNKWMIRCWWFSKLTHGSRNV